MAMVKMSRISSNKFNWLYKSIFEFLQRFGVQTRVLKIWFYAQNPSSCLSKGSFSLGWVLCFLSLGLGRSLHWTRRSCRYEFIHSVTMPRSKAKETERSGAVVTYLRTAEFANSWFVKSVRVCELNRARSLASAHGVQKDQSLGIARILSIHPIGTATKQCRNFWKSTYHKLFTFTGLSSITITDLV